MSKKSKGLGDTIKKITSATKIDKLAKKIAKAVGKDDCGFAYALETRDTMCMAKD